MIPLQNLLYSDWGKCELNPPSRKYKANTKYNKIYNDNNIITLDTETTSIKYNDVKCSFVYIAMISINGRVYYTRDLGALKEFFEKFDTPGAINVVYVHNLGFDFSFLQNVLQFDSVFARNAHKPIFARFKSWEFRCSYFLSQMSLKNVGKSYNLPHGKLIDGLDYGKIRNTSTNLTAQEEDYAELDVLTLHDYIKYTLDQNGGKYKNIPYTQTGFVRRYILDNSKSDKEYHNLRNIVKNTKPDIYLHQILENCYTGGYTHANFMAVACGLYTHVKSYDFTSSYPAVMVRCKFPVSRFRQLCKNYDYYIDSDYYLCVGKFRLSNVHAKSDLCYLSKHKIIKNSGVHVVSSNGRVYTADSFDIYLTDVDLHTVKIMYNCDIEVLELFASKADYLPHTIVKSILQLYENKTRFKGVEDKHALYMASKQMINSVYGMSVFNPFCDEISYNNGDWEVIAATPDKLDKYYNNRKTILPYQWGVFVTAWARQKLCEIASKIGNDVLYMDTDSIKFIGDYDKLFMDHNKAIHDENLKAAEHFKIDFSKFAPVDIKGKSHEIGLWDFEHEYKSFKVLGAKRYCYTLPGDPSIYPVVAGCNIQALRDYLMINNGNALLKNFRLNLRLDEFDSGKNTITYHDDLDMDIPVTDYMGNTKMEHVGFGAYMERTTFDMSMHDDYLAFLLGYGVSDKKVLIRNGVMID